MDSIAKVGGNIRQEEKSEEGTLMKYQEALDYIESLSTLGIVPGLQSIQELCRRLGNPQEQLRFVHVAGTNGKGSTLAFISTILQCAGYTVGRYTSPAVFEYRERFQVKGRMITQKDFCRLLEQVKEACEGMVRDGLAHPTPFEVETALAFLYYVEKKCAIVVMETGMGGLMDATNLVTTTEVAVLASISMDHMKFLGNTLGAIAEQKSGIIKKGCRVVSMAQQDEAMEVVRKQAESLECPLRVADSSLCKNVKYGIKKQSFSYGSWKNLEITLAGKWQIDNAVLAVEAVCALQEAGYKISEAALRKGLKETVWPGRFCLISSHPVMIVDGAHNEDAAKRLAETIEFYFTNKRIIYIMGILKDKEYEKIISLTHSLADQIITVTTPNNPRAMHAYELAREIAKVHSNVTAVDSLEEAVEISKLLAGKDDVIIAFGSLSYLGRLMEIVEKQEQKGSKKNGRSK